MRDPLTPDPRETRRDSARVNAARFCEAATEPLRAEMERFFAEGSTEANVTIQTEAGAFRIFVVRLAR